MTAHTTQQIQKTASAILHRSQAGGVSPKAISRALLLSAEAYATSLTLLVLDTYGPDVLGNPEDLEADGWAPETIKMQIEQDFGLDLPKASLDKIMAGITILKTNYFYKDVVRFIELCNILAGDDFQPDEFDPADAGEVLWGILEAMILYPPNDDPEDTEFSPEVVGYIEKVLQIEGVIDPPDVLRLGMKASVADKVRADYSDDPEMFSAIWDVQQGHNDDLKKMLQGNLNELAIQLQLLPMQQGKKDSLIQQVQQMAAKLQEPQQ